MIGQHKFKVVRPTARKLSTQNKKSQIGHVLRLEDHIKYHKLQVRLDRCQNKIVQSNEVAPHDIVTELENIDKQTVELQINAEENCRRSSDHTNFLFYQGLLQQHERKCRNQSNLIKFAWKMEIKNPKSLMKKQCHDGVQYCKLRLIEMKKTAKGSMRVHLHNCLIKAKVMEDDKRFKGIKVTI